MRGEEEVTLRCNGCWAVCDPKEHSVATACQHLYCLNCCQTIIESDDPTCPICTQLIQKSNIKAVHVLASSSDLALLLAGQAPRVALEVAHNSISFYNKQQQLYAEYAAQQSQRKITKTQEQCRKKLQEVHNGYLAAKRKYQEVLAQKHALQQDNSELQDKYNQKAMQDKKLKEHFAQLQQENEALKRQLMALQQGGGRSGGLVAASLPGSLNPMLAAVGPGAGSGTGRASRMAVLGMEDGAGGGGGGRRPGTAMAARQIHPDPSPVQSMHLGMGGGAGAYGFDTPDNPPALRQALNSGGGGARLLGGMGSGGGMGRSAAIAIPGVGQGLGRQGMGFNAPYGTGARSIGSI